MGHKLTQKGKYYVFEGFDSRNQEDLATIETLIVGKMKKPYSDDDKEKDKGKEKKEK